MPRESVDKGGALRVLSWYQLPLILLDPFFHIDAVRCRPSAVHSRACRQRPPRWPLSRWCALEYEMSFDQFFSFCCHWHTTCFHPADGIGAKCCRTSIDTDGFRGFVDPTLHFLDSLTETGSPNQSLWSLSNFKVVDFRDPVSGFHSHGLIAPNGYSLVMEKSNPVIDLAPIFAIGKFHLRLYHEFSEGRLRAIWERQYYMGRFQEFQANIQERSSLRYGTHSCDQFEAGRHAAVDDVSAMRWLAKRWLERGNPPWRTFVNIGSGDGVNDDPLYALVKNPNAVSFALAVEKDEFQCLQHASQLPHVRLLCKPLRVAEMFDIINELPNQLQSRQWPRVGMHSKGLVDPPALDVLKVDLDSIDCDVMQAFLTRIPAKVVVAEVNDGFPPPLQVAMHDGVFLNQNGTAEYAPGSWGCSLSYQVQILGRFGFQLVWYSSPNTVYVHQSIKQMIGLPSPLDEVDCFKKGLIQTNWPDGRMLRRWFYEISVTTALEEVRAALLQQKAGRAFTAQV